MSQNQPTIPSFGFLRLPQILTIFPISRSAWWEGCRTGRYPKPIKLAPRTTMCAKRLLVIDGGSLVIDGGMKDVFSDSKRLTALHLNAGTPRAIGDMLSSSE